MSARSEPKLIVARTEPQMSQCETRHPSARRIDLLGKPKAGQMDLFFDFDGQKRRKIWVLNLQWSQRSH